MTKIDVNGVGLPRADGFPKNDRIKSISCKPFSYNFAGLEATKASGHPLSQIALENRPQRSADELRQVVQGNINISDKGATFGTEAWIKFHASLVPQSNEQDNSSKARNSARARLAFERMTKNNS